MMRSTWPPAAIPLRWKPFMGQNSPWVQVNPAIKIESPQISTPINIELGGLPLSLGLFMGSGLSFLVRTGLPNGWPKATALAIGSALGVAGVVNLMLPKKAAPAAAPGAPPAPPAVTMPSSGTIPVENSPGGFTPPSSSAFATAVVKMVSPESDQTVEHTGTFFGIGTPKIPVQLELYNPSPESVTLTLEFEWDEQPSLIGYSRESTHAQKTYQVTLGPNEQRNEVVSLPMVTGLSTWTTVALVIYKKRTPNENRYLVVTRTFNIT